MKRLLIVALLLIPLGVIAQDAAPTERSSRKLKPPPPPPALAELLIKEIRYDAKLSDTEARFIADIDGELSGKGEASISILDGDVAVVPPKLPDGLRLTRDKNQYRLVVAKSGAFKCKIEFVTKITRTDPWNQITFTGPPAVAIASLAAEASGEGIELQLLSGTTRESDKKDNTARLRGLLGADRTVSLRWQSKAAEASRRAIITADTTAAAHITPSVIKFTTVVKYDIVQGSAPKLTVALPTTHALTRVEGDQIRDWQLKAEANRQLLTVELVKPAEKNYALTLHTEQTVDATPFTTSLTLPQPLDTERDSGAITVTAEDTHADLEAAEGFRQTNAVAPAIAAYKFDGRPATLKATLRRIEPVINVATRSTVRLEEARLLATHTLTLNVEKAGIYALDLSPVGSFIVADVKGEGVQDWKTKEGKLQISFRTRVQGAYRLEVQLEQPLKTFLDQIILSPLRVAGAAKETSQIAASSVAGVRLKTTELVGAREIPASDGLSFIADAADWKLTLAAEKLPPRVLADVFNLITIGDGLVSGSATIRYGILNQGVQEFRLKIPPHWKNVEFTGANLRRKEQQGDVWTIGLQDKAWGGYTLVVTYDFQFDAQQATLPVGGIHADGVERETGSIAITSATSMRLAEKAASDQLHRVDENDLAETDRALITRPVLLAYLYTGDKYDLTVAPTRFTEQRVLDAVADRTQLTTVLTEDGQMLTQATFMVKNNDRQFQRFTLPKDAEFWSCYVAGEPVKPAREKDAVLVPLRRGGSRDEAYSVEIIYREKGGSLKTAFPRSVALAAPGTDMQTTFAEWEIFVPDKHRLYNFGGNMTVAPGTTYGLYDAWKEFVFFYQGFAPNMVAIRWGIGIAVVIGIFAYIIRTFRVHGSAGLVRVLIVISIVVILAAMAIPSFTRARQRSQASTLINGARQLDAAIDQWAIENGIDNGQPIDLKAISRYVKPGSAFEAALAAGIPPRDPFGNDYIFDTTGPDQVQINAASLSSLGGVVTDWGGFDDEPAQAGTAIDTPKQTAAEQQAKIQQQQDRATNYYRAGQVAKQPAPPPAPSKGDAQKPGIRWSEPFGQPPGKSNVKNPKNGDSIMAHPNADSTAAIKEKLRKIIIPKIDFNQADIRSVVEQLAQVSRDQDGATNAGVNIIVSPDVGTAPVPGVVTTTPPVPLITLKLKDVPLGVALDYITANADLKYRVEPNAVVISPAGVSSGSLITKTFRVTPGNFENEIVANSAKQQGAVTRSTGAGSVVSLGAGAVTIQQEDVKKFFQDAGVSFPPSAGITFNKPAGTLIVTNTAESLEAIERMMETVGKGQGQKRAGADLSLGGDVVGGDAAGWGITGGQTPATPAVAGIRPLRIEIPKTGLRFVFTKVLNVGNEPLRVEALAWTFRARNAMRSIIEWAVFLGGIVILWRQWRKPRSSSALVALGLLMVIGSLSELLIARRLLHFAFIYLPPVLVIGAVIWLAWRWMKAAAKRDAAPPTDGGNLPPAVAIIALGFFLTTSANAAEPTITSASYTGTVRERVVEMEVTLQLTAGDSPIVLFGEDVAIESFSSMPVGAKLVRDEKAKLVRATLPTSSVGRRGGKTTGETTLKVKYLAKLSGDVTKRQLAFALPPAISSAVTLTIDEPDARVEFPTAVSFKTTTVGQQTRVEAILGAAERVQVEWQPRIKLAAEIAATVFCSNATVINFSAGAMNVRSVLDYQVTQGELRQARVRLPAGHRLLRVEGEGIRTWATKEENAQQILTVELQKGAAPSYRLVVETEKALEKLPASVRVETPHALDVKRETGWLAACGGEELNLSVESEKELQKIDAGEFERAATCKVSSLQSAFRFQKPEFDFALRVAPQQPQIEAIVRNRLSIASELLTLNAQVDYTIKRAGVFTLRLALPPEYRLDSVGGVKIQQWNEKTENGVRLLEVTLKERVTGAYALYLQLSKPQKELPPSLAVAGVHPLDTHKLTGFVIVAADAGIESKTESFDGVIEVPAASVNEPQSALAYKFIAADVASASAQPWKLAVTTKTLDPWVRAEIVQSLSITETLVSGRATVRYEVAYSPTKVFRVRVPAAFKNVEIVGANIRRRDQTGDDWRVELQSKVIGNYALTVTWDQPRTSKDVTMEVAGVQALDVERETGALAVLARSPLQVEAQNVSDELKRIDARELPEWAGRADDTTALTYRYQRPGYKLALAIKRFEEAAVLSAMVDNARLTTVIAEDGQAMTELRLTIRNKGKQYLEMTLPNGATVWSAFVAGLPVRPSIEKGKLLLPLDRAVSSDAPVAIELTYISAVPFPSKSGRIALAAPALDVPLKNARWDLYLPGDYRYNDFAGTMTRETSVATSYSEYTVTEYRQLEERKKEEEKVVVADNLQRLSEAVREGKGKDAISSYGFIAGQSQQKLLKEDAQQATEFEALGRRLNRDQAARIQSGGNTTFVDGHGEFNTGIKFRVRWADPNEPIAQTPIDLEAGEQQWDKIQKAQAAVAAQAAPLRVNLPTRGALYWFTQVLQTDLGKPMTIEFDAANARSTSWLAIAVWAVGAFVVLWAVTALVLSRRRA